MTRWDLYVDGEQVLGGVPNAAIEEYLKTNGIAGHRIEIRRSREGDDHDDDELNGN